MKIIHFANTQTLFVNSTLDWAIQNLPYVECGCPCHTTPSMLHFTACCHPKYEVITYTYDDLRQNTVKYLDEPCVLILEGGQSQPHHTNGWSLKKFKQKFPYSKIVLFLSDSMYYEVKNLGWQFGDEVRPDLLLELTPQCAESFKLFDLNVELISWTISRRLWQKLLLRAAATLPCLLSRYMIDFAFLANWDGTYRQGLVNYVRDNNYTLTQAGENSTSKDDLDIVCNNLLSTRVNIETTSSNCDLLSELGTQKGFRTALSISLGTLTVTDDHPNNRITWPVYNDLTQYKYGDFKTLTDKVDYFKANMDVYLVELKKQQDWLKDNLLDDLLYNALRKHGLI